jgi:AAA domain
MTTIEVNGGTASAVIEEPNPFEERARAEAAKPKKLSLLSAVTTRKRRRPFFGVLYGQSGIGKSTWATQSPKPIFIPVERGLDQITTPKLPTPRDFAELYAQVDALDKEEHEYQTIVLDTLDATELLIWARVCSEGKVKSIEEYGGGYGKGYVRARELWTGLLNKLSDMSERFNVLLLAHAHIKTVNDPSLSTGFDLWRIRLHDKSAEIVRQMVDLILFVQLETTLQKDTPKARKGRGIVSGDRVVWTSPGTGYEAKNRFSLPNPMPFEYAALDEAIQTFYDK